MRNKKTISIITLVIMSLSAIAMVVPAVSTPTIAIVDPMLIDENLRHRIENAPISTSFTGPAVQNMVNTPNTKISTLSSVADSAIGDEKLFLALDDYNGYYFFDIFTLYAQSENGEVWVQNDRSWPEDSDKDNANQEVTVEQAEYLLNEFQNNIYAKEAAFYGEPGYQDGSYALLSYYCSDRGYPESYCDWSDSNGRTAILVENVRDDNYYTDFPLYIAGFYSSTLDYYFDRNIMTIDSYDWINRVGPDGNRPYLYEGTFAHEYQHLIHDDYHPGDSNFVNEGFSDYAEYLCGYGASEYGHLNAFMAQPENSLTEWNDMGDANILADYGAAATFAHYIEDQYPGYITSYMQGALDDQAGIEAAVNGLTQHKHTTFDKLVDNWQLANLIRAPWGPYSYSSLDYELLDPVNVQSFVDGMASGYSHTYGTNYYLLDDLNGPVKLTFDGDTVSDGGWKLLDDGFWYSGTGNLIDRFLIGSATVDPSDPTLSFYTKYLIEEGWDFGFVQVSTDGGSSWTSLENEYTTFDNAGTTKDIQAELPGLTGGVFMGTMSFDLSAYAGQNVMIAFRYMTDWYTNEVGWFIDSASVTVSGSHVDLEKIPPPVSFQVTIVSGLHLKYGDHYLFNWDMKVHESTQDGSTTLTFFSNKVMSNFYVILVSPVTEEGGAGFQMNLDEISHRHH